MGFRAAHTCAKIATSGARDKFIPTHPPKDAVCDHHTAALFSFRQASSAWQGSVDWDSTSFDTTRSQ